MKYIILTISMIGVCSIEENIFFQNVQIKVGLENEKWGMMLFDECKVDITGKIIDDSILIFLQSECQKFIDQKYNA